MPFVRKIKTIRTPVADSESHDNKVNRHLKELGDAVIDMEHFIALCSNSYTLLITVITYDEMEGLNEKSQ